MGWKEGHGWGGSGGMDSRGGSHVTGLACLLGALHGAVPSLEIVSTKDSSPPSRFPHPRWSPSGHGIAGCWGQAALWKVHAWGLGSVASTSLQDQGFLFEEEGSPMSALKGKSVLPLLGWGDCYQFYVFQVTLPLGVDS